MSPIAAPPARRQCAGRTAPTGETDPSALHGRHLKIHFNLRTYLWSVTALTGPRKGRVIATVTDITLTDAIFKISKAGYLRAKSEGRRNVHAWVIGTVTAVDTRPDLAGLVCLTYRPEPRDPRIDDDPGFRVRGHQDGPNLTAAGLVVCAKPHPDAERGYAWVPPQFIPDSHRS